MCVSLQLDKNIIQSFNQLKDIFPEIVTYNSDIYFLYLNFGKNVNALLQFVKLKEDLMTLYIHCYDKQQIFVEFVRWFFWIFSVKEN